MHTFVRSVLLAASLVSTSVWAGAVDINHADAATIAKELNGIGPAHAKAIVEYRQQHGAFKSADDLRNIKGIGAKVIEKNRANIRVGEVAKK
jgi:competence protein ComEA